MAVQRPKGAKPQLAAPDAEFIDKLVKRSLEINPELRGSDSTTKFLRRLREQALAGAEGAPPPTPANSKPAAKTKTMEDRRAQTVSLFMAQKIEDHERDAAELREREEQLKRDKKELNERTREEIADFLMVAYSGATEPPSSKLLRSYRAFLSSLGVTDTDLLRRIKQRK